MTLQLRRKRQITVPVTPTICRERLGQAIFRGHSLSKSLTAVGLLLGALMLLATVPALAVELAGSDGLLASMSYSNGSQGSKLVWLPYRPSPAELREARMGSAREETVSRVARAEFQSPSDASQPAGSGPMSDPFGDQAGSDLKLPAIAPSHDMAKDPADDLPWMTNTTNPPKVVADSAIPDTLLRQGVGEPENLIEPNHIRSIEEDLASNVRRDAPCPKASDFKPINELTTDVTAESGEFPKECMLKAGTFQPRVWQATTFTWKASGLCHKPLYFEEIQLERYGHSWGPYLQPVISHGHFFISVPILPYLMGINPPNECMYTLGYYRPGNCAPYMIDPLPISVRAALFEVAAVTGAVALIP